MKIFIQEGTDQYLDYLKSQEGKTVRVCVSVDGMYRAENCTQMAIKGELEVHEDRCRVLIDEATYTYFTNRDVYMVTSREDREPCFYIRIDTNSVMSEGINDAYDEDDYAGNDEEENMDGEDGFYG